MPGIEAMSCVGCAASFFGGAAIPGMSAIGGAEVGVTVDGVTGIAVGLAARLTTAGFAAGLGLIAGLGFATGFAFAGIAMPGIDIFICATAGEARPKGERPRS